MNNQRKNNDQEILTQLNLANKKLDVYRQLRDDLVCTRLEREYFDAVYYDIEGIIEALDEAEHYNDLQEIKELIFYMTVMIKRLKRLIYANEMITFRFG